MIKQIYITSICVFLALSTFGQTLVLQDAETKNLVAEVAIFNKDHTKSSISNSEGEILLDVFGDYDAVDNSWSSGAALKSDDGSWTTQSGLGNNDSYLNIVQNGSMYCSSSTAYNTGQARFYTTDHDSGSQFYMTLGEQNNKVYFYSNSGYPSDYLNKVRCVKD